MPLFNATAHNEPDQLVSWVADALTNFRSVVAGLTTEQIRSKPIPSSELTLAWLTQHVGSVAEEWTARAATAPEPWAPDLRPVAELWSESEDLQTISDDATAKSLLADFDERVAATLGHLRTTDFDAVVPVPNMPWIPPGTTQFTGRWVVLHVLEEISRHSGHADILREAVDGAEMYSLRAEAESIDMSYIGEWFARHPEVPMPSW